MFLAKLCAKWVFFLCLPWRVLFIYFLWFGFTSMWFNPLVLEYLNKKGKKKNWKERRPWAYLMWGSYGFQVLSFLILTRLNGCFWLSFVLNGSFFFVFHDMFLFIYYYCYYYLFLWFGFTSMWFNTLVLEIWINQKKKEKN